jgi:hypothetical protein
MTNHIRLYLEEKKNRIARMQPPPILLRWLGRPSMAEAMTIIDKQVGFLLTRDGGRKKLEQWFLTDDRKNPTIH